MENTAENGRSHLQGEVPNIIATRISTNSSEGTTTLVDESYQRPSSDHAIEIGTNVSFCKLQYPVFYQFIIRLIYNLWRYTSINICNVTNEYH